MTKPSPRADALLKLLRARERRPESGRLTYREAAEQLGVSTAYAFELAWQLRDAGLLAYTANLATTPAGRRS